MFNRPQIESTSHRNRRQLNRLTIGLHVGCAVLMCLGIHVSRKHLLAPIVAEQQVTKQRSDELSQLLRSTSEVNERHAELVASLKDIRERQSDARRRIPEQAREDEVLEKLTVQAAVRNVSVKDYRRKQVLQRNGYHELAIAITCSGEFQSICHLLHDLTTFPRVIHVKQLKLTRSNAERVCDMNVDLALFFGANPDSTSDENNRSARANPS